MKDNNEEVLVITLEQPIQHKMICSNCGSEGVVAGANVVWDVESQKWEIDHIWDEEDSCRECDGDTTIWKVPVSAEFGKFMDINSILYQGKSYFDISKMYKLKRAGLVNCVDRGNKPCNEPTIFLTNSGREIKHIKLGDQWFYPVNNLNLNWKKLEEAQ